MPKITQIAAVSCGIVAGKTLVDLDYLEDSSAEVDANFVMREGGQLIEIQASAEKRHFNETQLLEMLSYSREAIHHLMKLQNEALGGSR